MAQVLSASKQKTKVTTSFQSYEASSLKTSWDKEDLLGRGSFATARRCIHDQLGRVVAKCFKVEGLYQDIQKVMRNVGREMKVLYRLKHQHIVAIHGITEWSNCIGIIMEYAEAGSLDFFLWLQGDIADIPLLLQLRFAHQISDGLRYLHHHDKKRSYLHCDLKPQNILLTPDLMVKIADFGSVSIATATGVSGGSFTVTSTTQHTPFYTAPELLGNILSDKKPSMDVYSYGMVLYAILTRHPAFSSDDPINPDIIIELIMRRGQKPRQKYLDDVESSLKDKPEDLEIFMFLKDIMVRCWDFEAKNRPDIQQVYNEIDEKLRSLNKSDVTYHISDLKKNEEPKPTPSSVKIELGEFSFPFEVGPQPSAFLPISEQSTSTTSIQDKVNESLSTLTIGESPIHKKIIPSQCKEHVGESVETSEEITFTEEVSKDDFAHPMEFLEHKPSDSSTSKHKCYKRLKKLPETFTAYFFLCEKHDGVKIVEKHVDRKFAHIAENEKENFKKISDQHFYHPNVVQYYDTVTQGEYTSLYMELCHGDLAKWVDNKLPECKLTSFEICQQATEGIYHLHMKCNMIHRDVKPSNFLVRVDEDGATVKVSDFGLSKALPKDASKVPTASTSTASYMAPEHHLGKDERIKTPWSKCSDIFSLGITFYHVLTRGGHPFGASHAEQVYKIQDKTTPVLDFQECSAFTSKLQEELATDLIKKMLHFNPEQRPKIGEVKQCLAKIVQHASTNVSHSEPMLHSSIYGDILRCQKHDGTVIIKKVFNKKFAHIAENEKENFKKISTKSFYHKNVVKYYDTLVIDDRTCILMEECDGNVEQWAEGKLPECRLTPVEVCKQATEGICHLHRKCNMIHRDVKPSNFLIRIGDGDKCAAVKVCDFGLTKILPSDKSNAPTTSNSTLSYMALEHHSRKDKEIKTPWRKCSDIFSLGITFYHILTRGGHPFGATHAEQVYRIQDKKSPVLDFQECSGLPSNEQRELACDLIKKMLDFDPKNRPTIENVKKHPFFWDSKKKFFFYKDANECFHQLRRKNLEKYQESLQRFARFDISVDNIPEPLRDSNLEDFPITEKKCRNVHHLVNRIRDMNEHATKKSEPSKLCLGVSENGSIDYGVFLSSLTGPYPRLLAELYECLSEEAIMESFY